MTEDQKFINTNFAQTSIDTDGYEQCNFTNCNFEEVNLSMIKFVDCVFKGCNLSLAKLGETVFRDVQFIDCKMLGLHFEHCHAFGLTASFDNCILNHSCFFRRKIKKTSIQHCKLIECDFTEADMSESVLLNNDFNGAIFDRTNLQKVDLRGSFNYRINPANNQIKKASFSLHAVAGLLHQYDIKIDSSK